LRRGICSIYAPRRLRHTLVDQRGEWQQRIQAVLYHRGVAQRRDLLTVEKRHWLEELDLPAAAREQVTVALTVIDALDPQSGPLTRELRAYGRRPPGLPGADGPSRHRCAERGHDPRRARRRAAILLAARGARRRWRPTSRASSASRHPVVRQLGASLAERDRAADGQATGNRVGPRASIEGFPRFP